MTWFGKRKKMDGCWMDGWLLDQQECWWWLCIVSVPPSYGLLLFSKHSLAVVSLKHLRWLGLRSLKEVSAGVVAVKNNPELCYVGKDQWSHLFRSTDQTISLANNSPPDVCGESRVHVQHSYWMNECLRNKTIFLSLRHREEQPNLWHGVYRFGLLGSRAHHVFVLPAIQPQGPLCGVVQPAARVSYRL